MFRLQNSGFIGEACCREILNLLPNINFSLPSDANLQLLNVDETAKDCLLTCRQEGVTPLSSSTDGNCLYNAVSLVIHGSEQMSTELRVRTFLELKCNRQWYENDQSLSRLLLTVSGDLYEHSLDCCRDKEWSNMWHIQALANVLNMKMESVLPLMNGNEDEQGKALNKVWLRRNLLHCYTSKILFYRRGLPSEGRYKPNHFVPLVQLEQVIQTSPDSNSASQLLNDISAASDEIYLAGNVDSDFEMLCNFDDDAILTDLAHDSTVEKGSEKYNDRVSEVSDEVHHKKAADLSKCEDIVRVVIENKEKKLNYVPPSNRSDTNFLIDSALEKDVNVDYNGSWKCQYTKEVFLLKTGLSKVLFDKKRSAYFVRLNLTGKKILKTYVLKPNILKVQLLKYTNRSQNNFRKTICKISGFHNDEIEMYPLFLKYYRHDASISNDFILKPHGNSKINRPFQPTKPSVLDRIREEVSNPCANVGKKYSEFILDETLNADKPRDRRQLYNLKYNNPDYSKKSNDEYDCIKQLLDEKISEKIVLSDA